MYIKLDIGQLSWLQISMQIALDEVCQRFQAVLTQAGCDSTLTWSAAAHCQGNPPAPFKKPGSEAQCAWTR